jgi:tryptophanase
MAGRDPATGDNRHPPLELLRLAVPRRVYTARQLEHAADTMAEILADPESVPGYEFVSEAAVLRHFTARFRPLAAG